jgi:hypothetical protein
VLAQRRFGTSTPEWATDCSNRLRSPENIRRAIHCRAPKLKSLTPFGTPQHFVVVDFRLFVKENDAINEGSAL